MEWKREVTVNCRIWGEGIYEGEDTAGTQEATPPEAPQKLPKG